MIWKQRSALSDRLRRKMLPSLQESAAQNLTRLATPHTLTGVEAESCHRVGRLVSDQNTAETLDTVRMHFWRIPCHAERSSASPAAHSGSDQVEQLVFAEAGAHLGAVQQLGRWVALVAVQVHDPLLNTFFGVVQSRVTREAGWCWQDE